MPSQGDGDTFPVTNSPQSEESSPRKSPQRGVVELPREERPLSILFKHESVAVSFARPYATSSITTRVTRLATCFAGHIAADW